MIHVSAKTGKVVVPYRTDLHNLFTTAPRAVLCGQDSLVLPHDMPTTKLLAQLGVQIPAPVTTQYDWCGGTPFDVQIKTAALLTMNERAYVLNGMGTGKTKAALWSYDFLRSQGLANKALVCAPLSTLNFTWAREIFSTVPHLKYAVLHGPRGKRSRLLGDPSIDVYIINHDGIKVLHEELSEQAEIDTLIIDELAAYRNGTSQRTKLMRKFVKPFKWVWGMTGSPTPNEPTDAWAQASIITPNTVPKYFGRFRDDLMQKISPFKYAPKPDAVDKAFAALQPAVRFTLDDVVELPELVEQTVDIEMGPDQLRIYKEMKKAAFTKIAANEITAMNAGVVLNKLLQISAGWVYSAGKDVVSLDNENRLDRLVDDIDATTGKVIVFVPFVHALDGVVARLLSEKVDCISVSGATSSTARNAIFTAFQQTNKYRVLVAHPQVMAHGVTLTASSTIIWFAPTPSLEIFDQANARIRRYGQRNKQLVLMYQSSDAERKTYTRLRAKQATQNTLLEMFAEASA